MYFVAVRPVFAGKTRWEETSQGIFEGWQKKNTPVASCRSGFEGGEGKNTSGVSSRDVFGCWEKTLLMFPAGAGFEGGDGKNTADVSCPGRFRGGRDKRARAFFSPPGPPRFFMQKARAGGVGPWVQKRQMDG